jgi:preprotein translocase subunit SecG
MTTLHTLILIFHVIVGAMIIGLVLVQRGKGAETGAAFGAGASATVFGAKGSANFLSRSTAVLATVFFATSLGLAYLGSQRPVAKSIVDQESGSEAPVARPAETSPVPAELPVLPAAPTTGDTPAGGDGSTPKTGQ